MLNHSTQSERGASGFLVAGSLLLLMGIAAIALDISAGFNERRQDQTASDAAALAAGVAIISGGGDLQAVGAAKQLASANLNVTIPGGDWLTCTDSGALGSYTAAQATALGLPQNQPCISFGSSGNGLAFDRIRVKIPTRQTPTVFGRVLGALSIQTSAVAEVTLEPVGQSGAFPAGVYNGAGAGNTFCIKTSTGGPLSVNQSCGTVTTGDFGNFQPYFYTELAAGNPTTLCTSGNQTNPLSYSIAHGLDHILGVSPGANLGTRVNGSMCPQAPGPISPDRVDSGSGYSNTDITQGLITGGTYDVAFDGRYDESRYPWAGSYGLTEVFDIRIDNRALWTFMDPAQAAAADAAIPGPGTDCADAAALPANPLPVANPYDAATDAVVAAYVVLQDCLRDYAQFNISLPNGLFVEALYDSLRLTIVPEYWQNAPIGNNACCYDIKDFRPAYLNSIWTSNGAQWTCAGSVINDPTSGYCRHDPGREGTISIGAVGQRRIDSASAILLNCDMLAGLDDPEERCKKIDTGSGNNITAFLNLFLTK